ncbi:metal ABC transporter substrate-binding protein [Aureimonas sp. AU4]|uniref:metal ABC transporter substrate-binding protein n=1 Tax=Aureimonas sp. AU4 TaxID=1638163 RepID=UPI000AD06DBF|nr:metal ABC transporter substrate-binding protein [Aureimonas sp. AU4]
MKHLLKPILVTLLVGVSSAAFAQEPLSVVASFSILGDMVREIGGDHVAVTTLVGPDADAHVFEPSPRDTRALRDAKLLVTNGLQFEGWLPRLSETSGFTGETVVASNQVTARRFSETDGHEEEHEAAVPTPHGHADEHHDHGTLDPHAWQDLRNGVLYVRAIADGLAKVDPDHAGDYRARASSYTARLTALDASIRQELSTIPASERTVVTSHDAFGYFAQAYDIRFVAPEGVSTESEASASDVAAIIRQIRDEKIKAVFVENITNPKLLQQIAGETGAAIGGSLFSDALSGPGGPAPTYEQMFRYNAETILRALKTS